MVKRISKRFFYVELIRCLDLDLGMVNGLWAAQVKSILNC